jgi:hypothetical protein
MTDAAERTRIVTRVPDPRFLRDADGTILRPPTGWVLLPPGDATLTRRVKEAGPTWTIQEKRGNKIFSRGVLAPPENIAAVRAALERERATPEYARARARDVDRRERVQSAYVEDFGAAVQAFLRFSAVYATEERALAAAVTTHATPVGSGTVARTQRIPVEERAEAAVIAWMRHQTTAYDSLKIDRVKGARREVRRELAEISRALLSRHRTPARHVADGCPLCRALAAAVAVAPTNV